MHNDNLQKNRLILSTFFFFSTKIKMFFNLPEEIIRYIYEFDNTYREIFQECLQYLTKFCIYKSQNRNLKLYYVYNPESKVLHMTNDLKNPVYICSSFGVQEKQLKDLLIYYSMKRRYDIKLEYDIENYLFRENYI